MTNLRYLGMTPKSQSDWVEQMHESKYLELGIDFYNAGEAVELLEQRTADILGKPAAMFFPKGMAAQFAMLKTAESLRSNSNLILHPLSHLAWDERDSYTHLLGMNPIFAGSNESPITAKDLNSIKDPSGTLVIELPLRRAGFRVTPWYELLNIAEWARAHAIHLHMDGARLWESACYLNKTEAEIAALFDTVYVSFYKGIGGMGGAVLAGGKNFIAQCRFWRSRLAADQFTAFPQVITALDGLDNKLKKIPDLVDRAHELAAELSQLNTIEILQPHTNGFILFLDGNIEQLNDKAKQLTEQTELKLFNEVSCYPNSQRLMVELQVGHEHDLITNREIVDYFVALTDSGTSSS